jgi:hypothetical protein
MRQTITLTLELDDNVELYGVPVVTIERAWRREDGSLSSVQRVEVQPVASTIGHV